MSHSLGEAPADWYRNFFEGLAAELWRAACPPERTAQEAALVADALDVDPGDALLDLASGDGRLAVPLAAVGYRITAVDLSPRALAAARAGAAAAEVELELCQRDLRDLPWPDRFQGAYFLGNSLGYEDAAATGAIFAAVAACLQPGRRLLLHSANLAETLLPFLEPQVRVQRGGIEMRAQNAYDPEGRVLTTRYRFRRGQAQEEHLARHHVFTLAEVEGLLRAAGLETIACWSSLDGEPFAGEAEEVWILAEKRGT
ncbi:SAM-dependent methyltransferase [Aquibaculum arenosum]|uniref:Class I SAM-dependent methyltransferase n=1 Tax=Aquibaculum arenosum TaxID=3032591 RepID=A0ABT5YKT6_9PROT|nr:class I SAM-dependent methyltransferase [Fodinicurvata sp. CAU 1616]MDF2095548.1 class I SAM-dependent methyltransferase [Fodinicurvata sp. CAU 1616]